MAGKQLRDVQVNIRMIFQDLYASLNPRRNIGDSVVEAGDIQKMFKSKLMRAQKISETLQSVGLDPIFAERLPHEFTTLIIQGRGPGRTGL